MCHQVSEIAMLTASCGRRTFLICVVPLRHEGHRRGVRCMHNASQRHKGKVTYTSKRHQKKLAVEPGVQVLKPFRKSKTPSCVFPGGLRIRCFRALSCPPVAHPPSTALPCPAARTIPERCSCQRKVLCPDIERHQETGNRRTRLLSRVRPSRRAFLQDCVDPEM